MHASHDLFHKRRFCHFGENPKGLYEAQFGNHELGYFILCNDGMLSQTSSIYFQIVILFP